MDKYEYKLRADEIKELIAGREYAQAAEIADTIDWRRVKSTVMLCTISDLYKINRRYEDAKNMLLLAEERRPGSRTICYALCELSIKMGELGPAVKYYTDFAQIAPSDDYGRYILQYKLLEAQEASLEARIGVLEEYKKRDYREKWAYELAYLYHRVGLATRCVEECDELILWFGDGKYVIKAMELKMLHQPLSPEQQEKYDHRFDVYVPEQEEAPVEQEPAYGEAQDFDGVQEVYAEPLPQEKGLAQGDTKVYESIHRTQQTVAETAGETFSPEEMDIRMRTMDMWQLNVEAELAAGMQEVMEDDKSKSAAITRSIVAPMMETESLDDPELTAEDVSEEDVDNGVEEIVGTEVFFGETGEINNYQTGNLMAAAEAGTTEEPASFAKTEVVPEMSEQPYAEEAAVPEISERLSEEAAARERNQGVTELTVPRKSEAEMSDAAEAEDTAEIVMRQMRQESVGRAMEQAMIDQPPKELAGVLSQGPDGQISLVVPERETVEKQITGQMSITDILTEWEQTKKETEKRRKEEVRQRVLQRTGNMFTEFEAAARDGLLEQLESGQVEGEITQEFAEGTGEGETADSDNAGLTGEKTEADAEPSENEEYSGEAEEEIPGEDGTGSGIGVEESVQEIPAEELLEPDQTEESEFYEAESEGPVEYEGQESDFAEESTGKIADTVRQEENFQAEAEPGKSRESYEDSESEEADREPVGQAQAGVRALTREEKELFAPYIQSKAAREQLVKALDNISMASYTGNIIITGGEGMDTATLAKNMIREVQMTDSNFSGKAAKITGQALNKKDVSATLQQLKSGALIIQKASGMDSRTATALHRELQGESLGIIVVMEDTKKAMGKLLTENKELADSFTARVDVEALSNDMLVSFGKQYARGIEYSIDDLGILALHTRIEELQTLDHAVTVMEVKDIVDEAVRHANRKTLGHFVDVLLAKRYDEEDMIVLTEKDFA